MTDAGVAPPAAADWDVEEVAAQALAILRLGSGDVDKDRVQRAAVVACGRVDSFVDRATSSDPTPAMVDGAVQATINLYRRKDAPFGVADSWSTDTVPVDVPGSPIAGARAEIVPDKHRWGVG